ncbi:MAG: hypothetical protein ABSA34_01025 [Candidatus Goldiibacteriota bacterium]|jgi:hypothetical protein
MSLVNCARCGNIFNSLKGQTTCQECALEENRELKKVTEYLLHNPLATVLDVNEHTGVAKQMIFKLINSGSLTIRAEESKPSRQKKPYK